MYLLALLEQPFADRAEPETAFWNEPAGNHLPQEKEITLSSNNKQEEVPAVTKSGETCFIEDCGRDI